MKKENVNITDASGGYNDLVSPSGLQANEMAILENYYTDNKGTLFKKRLGSELIQHAPVGAFPFTADAYTIGLWHLDDAVPTPGVENRFGGVTLPVTTYFNDSNPGAGRDLSLYGGLNYPGFPAISPVSTATPDALFPTAAPIAKRLGQLAPTFDAAGNLTGLSSGSVMANGGQWGFNPAPNPLQNKPKVTFETWINIPASYTSKPIITAGFIDSNGQPAAINDPELTDIPVLATVANTVKNIGPKGDNEIYPGFGIVNGLSVCHSGTAANNYNGKPFIKFTLNTLGSAAPLVLQTNNLPTGVWLHVKGDYDASTGLVRLVVNGSIVDSGSMTGNIKDVSKFLVSGGKLCYLDETDSNNPVPLKDGNPYYVTFPGALDEMRLSLTTYALGAGGGNPYRLPNGQGFEFAKSDGTKQAVISAEGFLYYTLGDGKWVEMGSGFSPNAYWDAVFYKDILYLSNGIDTPKAWDGKTLVNWGAPTTPPLLYLDGAGNTTNGLHKFAYTYVYGDYETALSPAGAITITSKQQIEIYGIPERHANCTAVRIYATKASSSDYYLVREVPYTPGVPVELRGPGVINGTYTTDTGAFNLPDNDLGDAGHPAVSVDVLSAQSPNPKYLVAAHDRLFVCGMSQEPYTLRWSELGTPDVFNALGFAKAATNKGALIALAEYYGEIHASKDGNATLVLRGDSPSSWSLFETLHPNIGCIDHWGYVHRYLVNEDRYTLCFPGKDGFYEYAGQQIQKISDRIKGTTDLISLADFTRSEWSVDNTNQFLSTIQPSGGGSSTANVRQPAYETDGIVQTPEQMGIVNQLEYIGLWNANNPLVTGNIIAICKAPGEGHFYFSTDDSNSLYYTTDNFATKATINTSPMDAAARIIEITRRGTDDFYYLLTDSASLTDQSSAGGKIYTWDNVAASIGLANTTTFYYDLDVPYVMTSSPNSDRVGFGPQFSQSKNNIFINHNQKPLVVNTFNVNTFPKTIYQNVFYATVPSINSPHNEPPVAGNTVFYYTLNFPAFSKTQTYRPQIGPGFWYLSCYENTFEYTYFGAIVTGKYVANGSKINVQYTRREFAAWRGGTFRPNSFWDAANNKLVFLASGAEDPNGNRFSNIYTLNAAATLVKIIRPWNIGALTTDGTRAYWTEISYDNTFGKTGNSVAVVYAPLSNLAGPVNTALLKADSTPYRMAIETTSGNLLVAHKKFNQSNTQEFYSYSAWVSNSLVGSTGALTGFTSAGDILKLGSNEDYGPLVKEFSKQTNAPNNLYGIVDRPLNAAVYSFNAAIGSLMAAIIYKADTYSSPTANVPTTGILSNALFVPSSSAAGGNLWADRLYWMAQANALPSAESSADITATYTFNPSLPLIGQAANLQTAPVSTGKIVVNGTTIEWNANTQSLVDILNAINSAATNVYARWDTSSLKVKIESTVPTQLTISELTGNLLSVFKITAGNYGLGAPTSNGRLVQLGVDGVWTVIGQVECEYHNLGIFDSFDTFSSVLQTQGDNNRIDYYLRNATDATALSTATYYSQENNRPILGFAPALPYIQWKAVFTWDYNYQAPSSYPFLASAVVGYFTGRTQATRIIGAHYNNRTYWAVATQKSAENNLVLVYQKNSTWARVTNWNMTSMFLFRNMFVGFDNYDFLHLEAGHSDQGKLIFGRARTGQMLGTVDKMISRVQVNISSFNDTTQPGDGYVKIVPIQGETELTDAAWYVRVPNSAPIAPLRISGSPVNGFKYPWARSFAVQIMSSDDNANNYQDEEIQSVDLVLDITGDTYDLPVK